MIVQYEMWQTNKGTAATKQFAIIAKIPGEQRILCEGMYERDADVLFRHLNETQPKFEWSIRD